MKYWTAWRGLRRCAFTCVGWQVTLRDPIWQVTLRSSVVGFHEELYTPTLTLHFFHVLQCVLLQVYAPDMFNKVRTDSAGVSAQRR